MQIEIAQRLKPYSHIPGTQMLLPGSPYHLTVYPARLQICDTFSKDQSPITILDFEIKGPVAEFTALQNLENGSVQVWGKAIDGFFRYTLTAYDSGILLEINNVPPGGVRYHYQGKWPVEKVALLNKGDTLWLGNTTGASPVRYVVPSLDRLSLGKDRGQDWELIRRRGDFAEIFPFWHRLGQLVPAPKRTSSTGALALIDACQKTISEEGPEFILSSFKRLFLAGFEGLLMPRLRDTDYHGIVDALHEQEMNDFPISILVEGAKLIRTLFVDQTDESISILPTLPPEFHCGRLLNVPIGTQGVLSIEWSKKDIRRVIYTSNIAHKLKLHFMREKKRCRLRSSFGDRGSLHISGSEIEVVAGQQYWFDNFQK